MSFWDKTLSQVGVVAPQPSVPVYPQAPQQPLVRSPQVFPQQPPEPEYTTTKAQSAKSTLTCPDCGSGNMFKPTTNMMEQCYHCGWNPRFAHSTAGAGLPSDGSVPTSPSRQVSTANNFNPQTIVDTVK